MLKKFEIISVDDLIKRLENCTYNQLHIHHTWKPDHSNFNGNNHIQLQRGMYDYHTKQLGWRDIGQHVTLMPDGTFVTGRDFSQTPASIRGWNVGAFAVEMLGNFDKGKDNLKGKQKESIFKLAKYFGDRFGYNSIKFHREGPGVFKTCPGSSINKEDFIKEVKSLGRIFTDVDDNRWSTSYIEKAYNLGLIKGNGDDTFNPEGLLTREQAAVLLVRLYEKIKEDK